MSEPHPWELTDEETGIVLGQSHNYGPGTRIVARAAQQKLWRWLKEICDGDPTVHLGSGRIKRFACLDCRYELSKAMGVKP